jgi:hypothetical protein
VSSDASDALEDRGCDPTDLTPFCEVIPLRSAASEEGGMGVKDAGAAGVMRAPTPNEREVGGSTQHDSRD